MKSRLGLLTVALWLGLAALDWLVAHDGAHDAAKVGAVGFLKGLPGFYGLLGLAGSACLILVAKALGTVTQRDEGYDLDGY